MKTESIIRLLAGTLVLVSVALGTFVNHWWFALAVFVGINLIQSVFTGFCPAEMIIAWFKARISGPGSDAEDSPHAKP